MSIAFQQLIPGSGGSPSQFTGPFTIAGTAGQFTCGASALGTGYYVTISGTLGGSGSITGYVNPTTYLISATNTTTTFTLTDVFGVAIVTSAGTPTGLTFTSAAPSGSFTPTAAGDQLGMFAFNGSNNNTMSFVGTSAFSTLSTGINPGTAVGIGLSCSAGAQTVGVAAGAGGGASVFGIEYSGVGSGTSPTPNFRTNPGITTGAILGTSVTVASGSTLIAFCLNFDGGTNAITSPSGTSRGAGLNVQEYCFTEYAGSGAAIQPSFTSADGTADRFLVMQILMSPLVPPPVGTGALTLGGNAARLISGFIIQPATA